MRHPWLDGLDWLVEASDRLLASLPDGDRIHISVERSDRGVVKADVIVDTRITQDELDDRPGLRRLERRAAELADRMPATREMTAHIDFENGDIVANIHDGSGVMVTLISHRHPEHGWRSADGIVISRRILDPPDVDVASLDPWIVREAGRVMGEGRVEEDVNPISMHHRQNDMLLIVLPAGAVHPPPEGGRKR